MKTNTQLRNDAKLIIDATLAAIDPRKQVLESLAAFGEEAYILAIGKAAWNMANAAYDALGDKAKGGVVITKYGHSGGAIGNFRILEAGHPVPDENGVNAAKYAIEFFGALGEGDNIILLISGGGSALFECPEDTLSLDDIKNLNEKLLKSGADIKQMNTVRKRISKVKGGKFAKICHPASIYSIILSDVLDGGPADIASGPAYPDSTTCADALKIISDYKIELPEPILNALKIETPKDLKGAEYVIIGSVKELCAAAEKACESLGYNTYIMLEDMTGYANNTGSFIGSVAKSAASNPKFPKPCAFIFGGETVVKVTGNGRGGRNQEIALSASEKIAGLENVCIFSLGSDGTDGPTDAAGGIVDGYSAEKYKEMGYDANKYLSENNSYEILTACGDILITGPTGTNINDITVVLIKDSTK